jgi:hypothetical protein
VKLLSLLLSALIVAGLAITFGVDRIWTPATVNPQFSDVFETISLTILAFLALVYVSGKWLWKWLWRTPRLGKALDTYLCPDLNGKYTGTISSNYADESGNPIEKEVEMEIQADFFRVSVFVKSVDNYQFSRVLVSELSKDPTDNGLLLIYVFESEVPKAVETDDKRFFGAARIKLTRGGSDLIGRGHYWTDRASQRAKSTAGFIEIRRMTHNNAM